MTGVKRVLGWIALGVGAAAAGGGAWVYSGARGRKADLEAKTTTKNGGPIYAISYQEARTEAEAIRGDLWLGGVGLGAGAALLAAGGWLIWSTRGASGAATSDAARGTLSGAAAVAKDTGLRPDLLDLHVGDQVIMRLGWSF